MTNEKQLTQDAYKFFGSPQGELILKDLVRLFGTDSPAFLQDQQGAYCPLKAAIRDGQRSVILHMIYASKRHEKTDTKGTEAMR
jgi:hypothetical protein